MLTKYDALMGVSHLLNSTYQTSPQETDERVVEKAKKQGLYQKIDRLNIQENSCQNEMKTPQKDAKSKKAKSDEDSIKTATTKAKIDSTIKTTHLQTKK